jgi:hypothetical protein
MEKSTPAGSASAPPSKRYPLSATAAFLNERLGLYLSDEQERGLAAGLLVGVAISAALLSWSVGSAIQRKSW